MEGLDVTFSSLNDYRHIPEIIEDGESFYENALRKAKLVSEWTGETAIADDSGLEVDILEGAPGIYSARYAGADANDKNNIIKLLNVIEGIPQEKRGCAFHCVLVLYRPDGHVECFQGHWRGQIADRPMGSGGFGYDPVFFLPELGVTVAQLPPNQKNELSHRSEAVRKLKNYLQKLLFPEI
jgi:XTP/dITP diphosphohydrolase